MTTSQHDIHYMTHALSMARRGQGVTAPNPSVGCVIVKNNRVIGRGHTARGGRPHAETIALKTAGSQAHRATAYVTLEPCAHHGQTPPCAQALIDAGVTRVVVGCTDLDPRVAGRGIKMLQDAGIEVTQGVCKNEALWVHNGFMSRVEGTKPFITLKIATTRDGFTTLPAEQGRWITGERARAHTHLERSKHDAVLAGVGTVLADDPALNARVPGFVHDTVRVVLDSDLRTPPPSQLLKNTTQTPLLILHNAKQEKETVPALDSGGTTLVPCDPHDLHAVAKTLAARGINRVLVEGGATVMRSFLESGLWDQILWYRAPMAVAGIMSNDVQPLDIDGLIEQYGFNLIKTRILGQDALEIYRKAK